MKHVMLFSLALTLVPLVPTPSTCMPAANSNQRPVWMNQGTMRLGGSAHINYWGGEDDHKGYTYLFSPSATRFISTNIALGLSVSIRRDHRELPSVYYDWTEDEITWGIGPVIYYYFLPSRTGAWYGSLSPHVSETSSELTHGSYSSSEIIRQSRILSLTLGRAFGINDYMAITVQAFFNATWSDASFEVAPGHSYGLSAGFATFFLPGD